MLSVCSIAGFSHVLGRHGRPTGFSSHGGQTPRYVRVPADAWMLSRRLAFWSDISLRPRKVLPFRSRPIPGPEIPAGSPRPKEGPKNYRADHILAQWRLGMGMGYREFSSEGVEIIGVLLTAGIWTICVDGSRTFPTGTVSGRYDNSS